MKKSILILLLTCVVLALTGCACKHETTAVVDAKDATCTAEGYTGDIVCSDCNEIVTPGETIAMLPHSEKLFGEVLASCTQDGYSGDTRCIVCNELITEGAVIPATGHGETELRYAADATCSDAGYTGDEYCTVCGELVQAGEEIAMLEHTPGEPENAIEPTCSAVGRTGKIRCTVCGKKLVDSETIDKLPHTPGERYNTKEATCSVNGRTGEADCTECGYTIFSEIIPAKGHDWNDGVCSICGWIEPGLYVDGVMQMSWDELVSGNYLIFEDNGNLDSVHDALYGLLVVSEELPNFEVSAFEGSQLSEVYVPATITELEGFTFSDSAIKTVKYFGEVTDLGYAAFSNCKQLESIDIPDSVTSIPKKCFIGCESLHTVNLPENLISIGEFAFSDTKALTSITFPEKLEEIGYSSFYGSGLVSVTLPASVNDVSMDSFARCENLTSMDMSASAVTSLFQIMGGSENLAEYKLPPTLIEGKDIMDSDAKVEHLVIPEGTELLRINASHIYLNEHLRSVVWPVSLKVADDLIYASALETIYYRGSEFQWSIVDGADEFANVNVVFNYDGE